jgi:hypothetical protein
VLRAVIHQKGIFLTLSLKGLEIARMMMEIIQAMRLLVLLQAEGMIVLPVRPGGIRDRAVRQCVVPKVRGTSKFVDFSAGVER